MSYSNPIEQLYQEELYSLKPKVVIVIPTSWDTIDESGALLLSRILAFVNQTLSSVQIIATKEADAEGLLIYRPSWIIAFGSTLRASGRSLQSYQPYTHDQMVLLQCDRLDELDESKKKVLRAALKEMSQGARA